MVTVGNFDGFHLGHRFLLRSMRRYAKERGSKTLVISFIEHTRIHSGKTRGMLFTPEQKEQKLNELGIHYKWLADFKKLRSLSYLEFLETLTKTIDVSMLIASNKLKIGRGREGDMSKIKKAIESISPQTEIIQLASLEVDGRVVSSSLIRDYLQNGDAHNAARYLGEYFSVVGKVARGNQIGREIQFPTLNIYPEKNKILPKPGVYLTRVTFKKRAYQGMSFVGRPTFPIKNKGKDTHEYVVESFLLNFSKSGYNKEIRVEFLAFLRENKQLNSVNELRALLKKDKEETEAFFRSYSYLY